MKQAPLSPLLVPATFRGGGNSRVPSALDAPRKVFLSAGRMALALGLEIHGLKPDDEVLLPAYSSPSMVTPILMHGARPVFYRLRADLSADLQDAATKLTPRTRVLLGVNYFGFSQDWNALRLFADRAGLILAEDCAHALFGSHNGKPLGSFGDFAIASLSKFLPVWDGGVLILNGTAAPAIATHRPSLRTEVKALFNLLEEADDHRRNPLLRPVLGLAKRGAQWLRGRPAVQTAVVDSLRRDVTGDIAADRMLDAPAAISRLVASTAARGRIAERRRHAYALYRDGLADVPGCKMPFGPTAEEVPFMAPVWMDDLARLHPRWVEAGIPMQRFAERLWPTIPVDNCPVAASLSRHLVQFPCHQDLSDAEIGGIIATVRSDLKATCSPLVPASSLQ